MGLAKNSCAGAKANKKLNLLTETMESEMIIASFVLNGKCSNGHRNRQTPSKNFMPLLHFIFMVYHLFPNDICKLEL